MARRPRGRTHRAAVSAGMEQYWALKEERRDFVASLVLDQEYRQECLDEIFDKAEQATRDLEQAQAQARREGHPGRAGRSGAIPESDPRVQLLYTLSDAFKLIDAIEAGTVHNAIPKKQVHHEPMTGTHTHLHASFSGDGDDGLHLHEHDHNGENPPTHAHSHRTEPGDLRPGKESGGGLVADNLYGQMNDPATGPAGRARLRRIMDAQHDAQR
jgi:hypothetical protein